MMQLWVNVFSLHDLKPNAIDIINCLKAIDYTKPPIKFVLHGKKGVGKSLTLVHVLHYAYENNFVLMHVPWVGQ